MGAMPGSLSDKRSIAANPKAAGLAPGAASRDRIAWVRAALVVVPLGREINDAKVLTGRQRPLTEVALLVVEIASAEGQTGLSFSYTLRTGGPAMLALARELGVGLLGEGPSGMSRPREKTVLWSAPPRRAGGGVGGRGVSWVG